MNNNNNSRSKLKLNAAATQLPIGLSKEHAGVIDLVAMEAIYFEGPNGETVARGAPGDVPVIRAPIRLSASDKVVATRAPQLGEHSDAILTEIGYDADAISALRAANII